MRILLAISTIICCQRLIAEELVLGGSKNLSLLPMIAEQRGFYREAQISVRHEVIAVGKLAMDAVISGTIDVGVVVDTNLSFISFRENNIKVIATILQHTTDGLAECSPNFELNEGQIRNKRVAYFPATTSHIFLARWLESHGLTMQDIRPVILQPTAMLPAIKSGAVDIVSIWNPWRHKILSAGENCQELSSSSTVYPSFAYLAVKDTTLKEKRTALAKLIKALIRADEFVAENEQEALAAYSAFTGMDLAATRSVWNHSQTKVQLDTSSIAIIEETIAWLRKNEPRFRNKQAAEPSSFFASELLQKIAPRRVTISK